MIPIFLVGLVAPFLVFSVLLVTNLGSIVVEDHLMHLVLSSVIVGYSLYTGYYYYVLYTKSPRAPLLFAGMSTLAFGVIFATHGLSAFFHGASAHLQAVFDVAEHYSLLISVLFFLGMALPFVEKRGLLYKRRQVLYILLVVFLIAGGFLVFGSVPLAAFLDGTITGVSSITTLTASGIAIYLAYRYLRTGELLLIYFTFGILLIASAAYVSVFYGGWNLLWWYTHLLFPLGYTAIFVGLINWERDDLKFSLFFGEIPFYRKVGTKFFLIIFVTGLLPLLSFGILIISSITGTFGSIDDLQTLIGPAGLAVSWGNGSLELLMFRFILMVALLAVLSAFFAFYFASKLVVPLKRLGVAAGRLARGETGVQVKIRTGDEIETLANSFDSMSVEITERTRELTEERARLSASIEGLSLGFIIADINDNIIVKNAAIARILGLDGELASVHGLVETLKGAASNLDVLAHSCRECVELRHVVEIKEVLHGKKYLRVFCTPVIPKGEDAIGYVILIEDITEAKIMERSRDEFFAVASHELRTPLTAIRGNADMILDMYADKVVDQDMKEMLQDIDTSSVRLIAIVNDFLEASRLEQGKIEIKKEDFNATELVEKVVRDLKAMIEQKGLTIVFTPPSAPLPAVSADKARAEEVLVNLVGNAIKYTKQGGITITTEAAAGFVSVRVTDTGIGISPTNQTLLFRKFQQAGEQMLARDVTQSTGLGLYISRLIMSAMGGTIGLERSELGKGSTFMFTLPIAQ